MKDFLPSEKVAVFVHLSDVIFTFCCIQVHVMMLVAEAKFQSSLLYAMRAVSDYYM